MELNKPKKAGFFLALALAAAVPIQKSDQKRHSQCLNSTAAVFLCATNNCFLHELCVHVGQTVTNTV